MGRKGALRQAPLSLLAYCLTYHTHLLARLESTDAVSQWMQQEDRSGSVPHIICGTDPTRPEPISRPEKRAQDPKLGL
jgi:hypothetical protein